jgi:RimJ/RimL family protein N-acetyltransferase
MIKGDHVGLRAVESEDLQLLRDWRNNTAFRRNFREVRELSMFHQNSWLEKTNKSPNDFMFMFERLSDGTAVGAGGLLYINWINRSADFSFYIGLDEKYIDDVYAKDATRLLLDYGFKNLNLNKIWMELYEFDHKKLEFFKNSFNFKEDGCLRDNCFEDGRYWNSYIISLTKKDYSDNGK